MNQDSLQYKLVTFYKYVDIDDTLLLQSELLNYCSSYGLKGKIYVASEGINASVSGSAEVVDNFKNYIRSIIFFRDVIFKEDITGFVAYSKLFVRIKNELVNLGVPGLTPKNGGKRLKPKDLVSFYSEGRDFIIVDTRNSYESRIGHFKNALLPEITNFREWPEVVKNLEQYKDKTVITYCTGGIRCEKASAYMVEQGFRDVYQLDGGIVTFLKECPDTVWEGGMFVFDERRVVEANTREELRYTAKCIHCGTPTAYHINCHNLDCDKIIVCCHECKVKYDYSCSDDCKKAPNRRPKRYG